MNYKLCRNNFSKLTLLFITEGIKQNTAVVEGGDMAEIYAKNVQIKINYLQRYSVPEVSTWWKHLLQQ